MTTRKTGRRVVAAGAGTPRRRRWLKITVASAIVVVFVVLVVVSTQRSASKNSASSAVVAASSGGGGTNVGGQVPPLRLTSINGTSVSVPSGRPGALFFSASYCQPCIPSSIALGKLKQRLGNRIDINWISIDPSDSVDGVRAFRQAVGNPSYNFDIDQSGSLVQAFQLQYLGTAVIYDRTGKIVYRGDEPQLETLQSAFAKAGAS
jgi:hypothetical protein